MSKAKASAKAPDLFDDPTPQTATPTPQDGDDTTTERTEPEGDAQVHRKELTRPLRHYFSPEERSKLADEMAMAVENRDQAEADLKAVQTSFKNRIAEAYAITSRCASALNLGWEVRPTKCEEIHDFREGAVTTVRLDTGEQIDRRPMTPYERQMRLV